MQRPSRTDNRLVLVGALAVLVFGLLACWFIVSIVSRISALVPLVAGVLLVLGNLREGLSFWRARQMGAALFNGIIGVALVLFGFGIAAPLGPLRFFFYGPALALLVLAVPMALGRPALYSTYGRWARQALSSARETVGGVASRRTGSRPAAPPPSGRETIDFDQSDIYNRPTQRYDPRQRPDDQ